MGGTMRKVSRFTFALLAASLVIMSGARALPPNEVDDTFYDCAVNEVGYHDLWCSGHVFSGGQQSGAYRFREIIPCDTGNYSSQWYYWNGSSWVAFSGPP